MHPYGLGIEIEKEECVNHAHMWMGAALVRQAQPPERKGCSSRQLPVIKQTKDKLVQLFSVVLLYVA